MVAKHRRKLLLLTWFFLALVICAGAATVIGEPFLDGKSRPACGRNLGSAVMGMISENGDYAFPNINGDSAASKDAFIESIGGEPRAGSYRYIPGLRTDDPQGLVLLYMTEPTRYADHLESRLTIWNAPFRELRWSLWGPKELQDGYAGGEQMDKAEFKRRIEATLDFLEKEQRPGWEKIVAEHRAWLANIDE